MTLICSSWCQWFSSVEHEKRWRNQATLDCTDCQCMIIKHSKHFSNVFQWRNKVWLTWGETESFQNNNKDYETLRSTAPSTLLQSTTKLIYPTDWNTFHIEVQFTNDSPKLSIEQYKSALRHIPSHCVLTEVIKVSWTRLDYKFSSRAWRTL